MTALHALAPTHAMFAHAAVAASTSASAPSAPSAVLSDARYNDLESLINRTIHELVFALHHAGDDQFEEAVESLIAIRLNLDAIEETLNKHAK